MDETKKILVAVYGSLRAGLGNHDLLTRNKAKYVGEYRTDPYYSLHSLRTFPALTKNGHTSIVMEVYEIDYQGLVSVDALENYTPGSKFNNFYVREKIDTPYGEAYAYFYVPSTSKLEKVHSGDWKEYYEETIVLNKILENADII